MHLVKLLILLTSMIFMLNQTHFKWVYEFLEYGQVSVWFQALDSGRWLVLALFSMVLGFRAVSRKRLRTPHAFDAIALLFLGLALISSVYSETPDITLQRGVSLSLLYIAVFWVVWDYVDRAGEEDLLNVLIYSAAIIYCLGIIYINDPTVAWQERGGRFRGVLTNPNSIGLLTGLFLPLVLWRVTQYKRSIDIVLLGVMILSLLLSGSRSGMLASSIGATYLLYHSQKRAWAAVFVAGAIYIIVSPYVVPYDPFSDDQPFQRLVSGFGTGSGRLEVWPLVLPLIQDRWVLGHGFGTEEFALANAGYLFQEFQGGYFHNSYLGLAYQLGIIGVLLFWGPLLAVFLWQLWRSRHDSKLSLSHVYEAVLLAGLISAMFESWVYSVGNAFSFPFWICVMLLVRRTVLERERSVGLPSTRPLIASTVTS